MTVFRLAFALLVLMTTSEALAQERPKVAVLNFIEFSATRTSKDLHEREHFDAAFARSLEDSGWSVVQATDESCTEGTECLADLASLTDVSRVLRITGQGNAQYGYGLHIEAFAPQIPRATKVAAFCDICNAERMAEVAADHAKQQLVAVAPETEAEKDTAPPTVAVAAPPPAPARSIVPEPRGHQPNVMRWLPWGLAGAGTAAMAFGGWAIYKNEQDAGGISVHEGRESHSVYSSATLGAICVISGGLAAITGVIWLLARPRSQAGVAVSPNQVGLHGRF